MITNSRKYNRLAVFVIILSMFAGIALPANIVSAADNTCEIHCYFSMENGKGHLNIAGSNFNGISSLSITVKFDEKILGYGNITHNNTVFNNSFVQTNEEDSTITIAVADTFGLFFDGNRNLFDIEYDAVYDGSEDIYFDITVSECKGTRLEDIHVDYNKSYYAGNFDNSLRNNYEWSVTCNNSELYSETDVSIGLSRNAGIYSGSFTLLYDENYVQYKGIKGASSVKDMLITDNIADKGKINVAFASSAGITNAGELFRASFITKTPGYSNISVAEMKITDMDLDNISFPDEIQTTLYIGSESRGNNIKISAPDSVDVYDYIDIDVEISENSGFAAMTAELTYDSDIFNYISCTFRDGIFAGSIKNAAKVSDGTIRLGVAGSKNITNDGVFATVRLQPVKEVTQISGISLNVKELIDNELNKLNLSSSIIYVSIDGTSNHMWDDGVVIKKPDCTSPGYKLYTCSACGLTMQKTIEKLGHTYASLVTEPTCTEKGYTTHTCTRCGTAYTDTEVEAKGHEWGEWSIVKEPGCESEGMQSRRCSKCEYVDNQSINPVGHNWLLTHFEDASYINDGKKIYSCSLCGESKETSEPMLTLNTPVIQNVIYSSGKLNITWNKVIGADGYRIYRRVSGDDFHLLGEVAGNDTTTYSDGSIMGDVTYYYVVNAYNSVQESAQGAEKGGIYASSPEITDIECVSDGIKLVWTDKQGIRMYRVYRKNAAGEWQKLSDVSSASYIDKEAEDNTRYEYCIVCMDAEGIHEIGNIGEKTGAILYKRLPDESNRQDNLPPPIAGGQPEPVPPVETNRPVQEKEEKVIVSVPKLKSLKNKKNKRIKINALKVKGVTGYKIQYSLSKKFKKKKTKIKTVNSYSKLKKGISKLKPGKKYYVRIAAYKKINGQIYTSKWSIVKKIVIKK